LATRVEMNLLVDLGNLDPQAPVVSHFLNRGEVDVTDLGMRRREVAAIGLRVLPVVLTGSGTDRPGLSRSEACHIRLEFMRQLQKRVLRGRQCWH
jgi:hypothetical protein